MFTFDLMLEFKIRTNKGKERLSCPDNIHELTFEKWIEIEESKRVGSFSIIKLFSILTGVDYDFIHDSSSSRVHNLVAESVAWYADIKGFFDGGTVGSHIIINDSAITIPKQIEGFSLGQHLVFSQLAAQVREGKMGEFEFMTAIVSVFLEPLHKERQMEKKNNKASEEFTDHERKMCAFSMDRAKAFEKTILQCKAIDIYPLYAFFLIKKMSSTKAGQKQISPKLKTIIRKLTKWRTIRG